MSKTRRNHSPAFKAKVAVEALQATGPSRKSPPRCLTIKNSFNSLFDV